jgi:hypothetical protein
MNLVIKNEMEFVDGDRKYKILPGTYHFEPQYNCYTVHAIDHNATFYVNDNPIMNPMRNPMFNKKCHLSLKPSEARMLRKVQEEQNVTS